MTSTSFADPPRHPGPAGANPSASVRSRFAGTAPVAVLLAVLMCAAAPGVPGAEALSAQEAGRFVLAGHDVLVEGDLGPFSLDTEVTQIEEGVEIVRLTLAAPTPAPPPELTLTWSLPAHDVYGQWTTAARFDKSLGPDWGMTAVSSMFARHAPVMTLFGSDDGNRLTFAASDALNTVITRAGVREENARVYGAIDFFTERHRPVAETSVEVRFDRRPVPYSDALAGVADWWAAQDGYAPASVPDIARLPMYSTWYSYHQSVDAGSLLREVEIGKELGYEAIIIDDGWQTLDSQRGYAFTGDWAPERIPDMGGFVADVHERGMKILLWYAMSLMGERAAAYPAFGGKYLRYWDGQGAYVLDPRYPEVRNHIIGTYRDAILEWDVDGFKLDFLGFFVATDTTALEVADGRDYASVSRATDRLMTDVLVELRKVKPDVMVEFRQNYIGPLMRKYGNMFRAGDSPNAAVDNRVRTIDLRLLSGSTAVHSDMFMWHYDEPVEKAAL
ncbi:MAG: alpha-galactosidase, partial [Gemmatimonadetes bacterium]|nr:alpha-galactosidase [Gemmatimonadota bacterium]